MAHISSSKVQVVVRLRPLLNDEEDADEVDINEADGQVRFKDKRYNLHHVFGREASNEKIYWSVLPPVIDALLSGSDSCVFTLGGTRSGKSHLMWGSSCTCTASESAGESGLFHFSIQQIFSAMEKSSSQFVLSASFIEVWSDVVCDLLARSGDLDKPLNVRDEGGSIYVDDLTLVNATEPQHLYKTLRLSLRRVGDKKRHHVCPSGAHVLCSVIIESGCGSAAKQVRRVNFVDLASAESFHDGSHAQTDGPAWLAEAVVAPRSFSESSQQSVLPRLLRDAMSGNCNTAVVATVSSASEHLNSTASTFDFLAQVATVSPCSNSEAENVADASGQIPKQQVQQPQQPPQPQQSQQPQQPQEPQHPRTSFEVEPCFSSATRSSVSSRHSASQIKRQTPVAADRCSDRCTNNCTLL
eukprot:gnl/MRDRNA2_/MRDRNA2_89817_c0_seq1.p1 gnl/MRDRNA2_/MRDRNA2_89817_c0~~gnl/MRDRNA2_/MRDRNA2_89817_c0_seq1.p1  ORF type:complete len:413 (-),score=69.33 gnl/MRDRNA2_/MRDRNA2_89817_c0_seq1:105-1343(-)